MKAAVFKPTPQMRAAVRGGLNRFCLIDAALTDADDFEGFLKLARLALISRAHLESVRRSARGIKFQQGEYSWLLKLDLGLGTPKIALQLDITQMIGIIQLLDVPVYLKLGDDLRSNDEVDWEELGQIGRWVHSLGIWHECDYSDFTEFINSVAPHLKVLNSTWPVLTQLPPLELERIRLYDPPKDLSELNRHKIRRLDLPVDDLKDFSGLSSDEVLPPSIKSLGFVHVDDWTPFPYDSIGGFCRRISQLEDLHIICEHKWRVRNVKTYFPHLWAQCLEIRDRLHVSGLKRLFVTIKHDCIFDGKKSDWAKTLKQVEPFDKASSPIDRSKKCVRMFLKQNEPRGPKPMFVLIKGIFRWSLQENGEPVEVGGVID
ncbi:hypothetical protein M3Y99_00227000 [Aphelenchoides fujianensis]|nr:hypothetical protein M3Y99_00227000 [Aphelenchoides fujianensis]